jgi:hypothetical protein
MNPLFHGQNMVIDKLSMLRYYDTPQEQQEEGVIGTDASPFTGLTSVYKAKYETRMCNK